ncbi:MAG: DNA polymerase III subunit gamma/tau [Planctomycetota bacterium]
MSEAAPTYRVFARKYRPRSFAQVIGQDHIVRALSHAIERGRVGQAYLLVGPRGVGKTTTARIIAKSMNCEKGPTVEPCLECGPCVEIERGNDIDVIEIDGASNNGVDDVRAIRDAVQTNPIRDRRKIYIIDEVQRLSGQAFDALLKTLEEPPAHAMFLFATTDPHKIPDTIVSRCQIFEFRRIREVDIQTKLSFVCQSEGMEVDIEVLKAIAHGCRGGMRDAESMLDQVLATAGERVTLDDLESVAGLARPERWLDLFEAVLADHPGTILSSIDAFLQRGGTERDFVEQSVDALRDLLHIALLGEDAVGVIPADDRRERTMDLARNFGRDRLEGIMGMMFHLESRMQKAPLGARALLEWTLLRAARIGSFFEIARLLNGEEVAATAPAVAQTASPPAPTASRQSAPAPSSAPASAPSSPERPPAVVAPTAPAPKSAPAPAPATPEPASVASTQAVAAPQAIAPPQVGAIQDFESLLQRLERERPTFGNIVRTNLVEGKIVNGEVHVVLFLVVERDRDLLEDPIELKALARLPWSPGAWRITFEEGEKAVDDPIVENLLSSFDGQEETP